MRLENVIVLVEMEIVPEIAKIPNPPLTRVAADKDLLPVIGKTVVIISCSPPTILRDRTLMPVRLTLADPDNVIVPLHSFLGDWDIESPSMSSLNRVLRDS